MVAEKVRIRHIVSVEVVIVRFIPSRVQTLASQ